VTYAYWADGAYDVYLDTIAYNGVTVKHHWELRNDPIYAGNGNAVLQTRYRLKSIDVTVSGSRLRAYALSYSYSTKTNESQLTSVQQFDRNASVDASGNVTGGSTLPAMTFTWGEPGTYGTETALPTLAYDAADSTHRKFWGDFNGDGHMDLLYQRAGTREIRVLLGSDTGLGTEQLWGTMAHDPNDKLTVGDFNGDGKDDYLYTRNNTYEVYMMLSTGTSFQTPTLWATRGYSIADSGDAWWPRDVNGDGLMDYVYVRDSTDQFRVLLSTGTGFQPEYVACTPTYTHKNTMGVFFMDVDGDGYVDLLYRRASSNEIRVLMNRFPLGQATFGTDTVWATTTYGQGDWCAAGDLNGDGKVDFLYKRDGTQNLRALISHGRDFAAEASWGTAAYSQAANGWAKWLVDLDGDGRADFFYQRESTREYRVLRSRGGSFATEELLFTVSLDPYGGNTYRWHWTVDVSGDGLPDFVYAAAPSGAGPRFRWKKLGGEMKTLVTGLTNGAGGGTTVTYTPSSVWSNGYLPAGMVFETVGSATTSDGRGVSSTINYNYQGALWSVPERRLLGFREVKAVLDAAGNYTQTFYHQHVGCIAKPEETYFNDPTGNVFSYTSYDYEENTQAPYTSLLTDRWDYECNQQCNPFGSPAVPCDATKCRRVVSQFGYDGYGNATTSYEHGDYGVTGDERTAVRGYYPNPTKYIVGLQAYENVYAGIGTGGTLMKRTRTVFDANASYDVAPTVGNVKQVQKWNSVTGGDIVESYAYDSWGNRTKATDVRGNATTETYDGTYHLYRLSKCNALNHCATTAWDYVLGAKTGDTDSNNSTINWSYDGLGRVTRESHPDGGYAVHSYLNWGDATSQRIRKAVYDGSADGQWEESYVDGLGRKYKEVKKGDFTQETQFSDTSKRVWKQSYWYATGETPKSIVYAYDGAGRERTVTAPDGSYSEKAYGNGTVTHYDELRHEKTTWQRALGGIAQIREKIGGTDYYTTYSYDAVDRVTRVVDAASNQVTSTYSSLGDKLSMCDWDSGCTTYEYDAIGNQTRRTDAKGQVTSLTYDALNRVLTKTYPGGATVSFTYDEAGRGASKGRVTTASSAAATESNWYDWGGRVTSSTKCLGGTCYTLALAFNQAGQLTTLTYPNSEVVTHAYDASGRLASITGFVTSFGYNASGRMTSATYANGTTGTFTYDANRQWLTDATWKLGGTTLYQAGYGYDSDARVTKMLSSTNPLSNNVTYRYDDAHRVTGVSGGQVYGYAYNAIGNMLSNTAVGSYSYGDSAHKHAVTAAGSLTYGYDANGNMTSGDGRALTWNADNQPLTVVKGGQTTTFAYGPTGDRVSKAGPNGTTYFFGRWLELSGGSLTRYYWAGHQLVAKQDGTGKYWYHADHLSSVRLMTNQAGVQVRGYDYAPYGTVIGSSGTTSNNRGWGGHRTDEANEGALVYMNARYYDPKLGRFISADPIVPDEKNPQALNRYSFGYNNPISNIDPTGHAPIIAAVIGVASIAGAAPAWVTAVALVGAVCQVAGYILKNPYLMSIGQILMGFAGGFTGSFLGGGIVGGMVGAAVAAATSPISPLSPTVKMIIGWAYTAIGLFAELAQSAQTQQAAPGEVAWGKGGAMKLQPGDIPVGPGNNVAFLRPTQVVDGTQMYDLYIGGSKVPGNAAWDAADMDAMHAWLAGKGPAVTPTGRAILNNMKLQGILPTQIARIEAFSLGTGTAVLLVKSGAIVPKGGLDLVGLPTQIADGIIATGPIGVPTRVYVGTLDWVAGGFNHPQIPGVTYKMVGATAHPRAEYCTMAGVACF
jgi:RHS repeat-associated protein